MASQTHTAPFDETDEYGTTAPRPVESAAVKGQAFERLGEGQGAVRPDVRKRSDAVRVRSDGRHASAPAREQAQTRADEQPLRLGKPFVALVAAGAVCVAVLAVVVFGNVLGRLSGAGEAREGAAAAAGGVSVLGSTFALEESEGAYVLVEIKEASDGAVQENVRLGSLEGVPVGLVGYEGAVLVPENLSDGTWDVAAYNVGSGWSKVCAQGGVPYGDKGELTNASLEGSVLVLTVDGARTEIPLTW